MPRRSLSHCLSFIDLPTLCIAQPQRHPANQKPR
jgi:hypothetical protein